MNFLTKINKLSKHHYNNSLEYKKIINDIYCKNFFANSLERVPFLPVNIFKEIDLKSIDNNDVFKILNSSGTTSTKQSRIFLDRENAKMQSKVLVRLVSNIIGNKRLPMIIIDERKTIQNSFNFNAKIAAYLGFSIFGSPITFLNKENEVDYENLNKFLIKFAEKPFLIFGFTFNAYLNFIKKIDIKKLKIKNFENGILIHGGGWKKLENKKISNKKFRELLKKKFNFKLIYNYYGLIEQTGSIFFESQKCGFFTTTEYSEILIRDKNLKVVPNGQKGFIQLLSLLPTSYPGHSILTEDYGEISNLKNCNCGSKKKHFKVYGRIPEAELRGCSDV